MEAVGAPRAPCANNWSETRVSKSSLSRGLSLFALYLALYSATLIDAIAPFPLVLSIVFAIANGVFVAMLFILGHDCCHGTLVPSPRLNDWLGRIAFLPVLHSTSLWREAHNEHHHGRTNLKGYDPVWAPMSVEEYRSASQSRRLLERVYRGAFGPVFYYLLDNWMPRLIYPFHERVCWRKHLPETVFVLAGSALIFAAVVFMGKWLSPHRPISLTLLFGLIIPFLVWNYLAAITTYMNHTHPGIPWFGDEKTWNAHAANVAGTVHVRLPVDILPLYSDVMAHTAHHAKIAVPVYSLPEEQAVLKSRYASDVKEYVFSIREYRRIYTTCKLFDFQKMCWTDFAGIPTSAQFAVQ